MIIKQTGTLGNNRSRDHPDYSIIKIGLNTAKTPGDLSRLADTQTVLENYQLTIMWKKLYRSCYNNNSNNNNNNNKKKDKYLDLARELKKLWNMKVTIVPIVIGALGTTIKGLLKGLEDLEVGGRVETIQTTALLRTARILRRVLET